MTTGEAIRAIREKTGLSQEKFAHLMSVSMMSVSRWERNAITPGAEYMSAIAGAGRDFGADEEAATLERTCGAQLRAEGHEMQRAVIEQCHVAEARLGAGDIRGALDAIMQAERIARDVLAMLPEAKA